MKQSESIANLAAALVKAQSELKAVGKDAVNPHFKNRYASLDSIIDAVRPVLAKHGLAVVQGASVPETNEHGALVGFAVETMLIHSSGEWLSNSAILPVTKSDPQGAGGALTYGRRYGLSALLSLATEDDDDGNVASRPAPRSEPARQATPPKQNGAANGAKPDHAKKMPFGDHKGKPLGEIPSDDLESTIKWCEKNGREKWKDLIGACRNVLGDREHAEFGEMPELEETPF